MKFADVLRRLSMGRALLLGFVIGAFYYWAVFDDGMIQKSAIAASEARVTELRTQIDADQRRLDSAAVFKRTAAEVGGTINRLLKLIPEKYTMSDLMRLVSNEAKVAGSSLNSIEPRRTETSAAASEFEEISLRVNLAGSFLQHMVFLSNLTKVNQILIIRNYKLDHSKDGKGEEAPTVTLEAEIVAYRYRGNETKPKAPEGAGQ